MNRDGRLLFFRYAYPCAEDRLKQRLMSSEDYKKCVKLAHSGRAPDAKLLERCFPDAIRHYRNFFGLPKDKPLTGAFSVEDVQMYWRHHHEGSGRDCAIYCVQVHACDSMSVLVHFTGRPVLVLNPYKLKLRIGSYVFIHKKVIAEAMTSHE